MAFARTPVGGGTFAYTAIGWWLRSVCWILALFAIAALGSAIVAVVFAAQVGAMSPATFGDAIGIMFLTIAAAALLTWTLGTFLLATGIMILIASVYGGYVARRPSGLHGARWLGVVVALLGGLGIALGLSPRILAMIAEAVTAIGIVVALATCLPAFRREFSAA